MKIELLNKQQNFEISDRQSKSITLISKYRFSVCSSFQTWHHIFNFFIIHAWKQTIPDIWNYVVTPHITFRQYNWKKIINNNNNRVIKKISETELLTFNWVIIRCTSQSCSSRFFVTNPAFISACIWFNKLSCFRNSALISSGVSGIGLVDVIGGTYLRNKKPTDLIR